MEFSQDYRIRAPAAYLRWVLEQSSAMNSSASKDLARSNRTSPARIERVAALAGARFALSVVEPAGLPPETGPEIAFVGRSNAGKSSAINRMVGENRLAYVSKMPGRTRELNFFSLRGGGYLVDLPGYGFARTPRNKQRAWSGTIDAYLGERRALLAVVLVMDIRHAPHELDLAFIDWLRQVRGQEVALLGLLSKIDKLTQQERAAAMLKIRVTLSARLGPRDTMVGFSSMTGIGLPEVDRYLGGILHGQKETPVPQGESGVECLQDCCETPAQGGKAGDVSV